MENGVKIAEKITTGNILPLADEALENFKAKGSKYWKKAKELNHQAKGFIQKHPGQAVGIAVALFGCVITGCQPRTPAEKVMNKVEDATHETGQAVDRARERIKDTVN